MKFSDYKQFHPNAEYVRDGRTANAILRRAAKILGIDWREYRLCIDTPYHYIDYRNRDADGNLIDYNGALQKVEYKGKKGFGLVYVDGCFCPYLVSNN